MKLLFKIILIGSIVLGCYIASTAQTFPQWGNLKPGKYAVGYKVIRTVDQSRTYAFKDGRRVPRPMQIYIWYPAKTGKAMQFGEYFNDIGFEQSGYSEPDQLKNFQIGEYRKGPLSPSFPGGVTDEILTKIFATPTAAIRNAAPVNEKFPVAMHMHVSGSTAQPVLCEYLASHGYVVASISWVGLSPAFFGRGEWDVTAHIAQAEDLMFAYNHVKNEANADAENIAMVGMFANQGLNLQMKEQLFDAIACTDCSFEIENTTSLPYYDPRKVKIPIFEIVNSDFQQRATISDSLIFAKRWKAKTDIEHLDFYPFRRIAKPENSSKDIKYEYVARMTLNFLNGVLKQDQASQSEFEKCLNLPEEEMSLIVREAQPAVPTQNEFLTWLREGNLEKSREANQRFGAKRISEKNPMFFTVMFSVHNRENHAWDILKMYAENYPSDPRTMMMFNGYGYAFLQANDLNRAEEAFAFMIKQFPASPYAQDAWADYLVAANQKDEALKYSFKVLETIPSAGLSPEQATGLRKSAQEKIDRLTDGKPLPKFDWKEQSYGADAVGFKTVKMISKTGNPMLVSIWYPAKNSGTSITLKDYILADTATAPTSDLVSDFKRIAERIYDRSFRDDQLKEILETKTHASKNAEMKPGKFPLIIASSDPAAYPYTFERMASEGYVVAAVTTAWSSQGPDASTPYHYTRYTDALQELLTFMKKQTYVNTADITAFGHGGGIQSATYLAMRTTEIRRVVNLDGGFFGPRSKTTNSADYKPAKLKVPFLHIVTVSQQEEDDQAQVSALKHELRKVSLKSPAVRHHDFTSWGRLTINSRGTEDARVVNETLNSINELILKFLKGEKVVGSELVGVE